MTMTLVRNIAVIVGAWLICIPAAAAQSVHGIAGIEITIEEVRSDPGQGEAGANETDIPMHIAWTTEPWGDRKLLELEARLEVTNSDGSTSESTKTLAVNGSSDTLSVSVPGGAQPVHYELEITGNCQFVDADGKERIVPSTATKSGNF